MTGNEPSASLLEKVDALPRKPGVYTFYGKGREVIYVGKAKDLRARVRTYFTSSDDGRMFYPFIVRKIRDIEILVTDNDKEALILENNVIKRTRPRYNIRLADDKTYLSLKVTLDEEYPRVILTRRIRKDGGLYFGPFASATAIKRTVDVLRRFFPIRTCTNAEFRQRSRPCIQHEIGRCGAPCVGEQSEDEYQKVIDNVILFLGGRHTDLVKRLEIKMAEQSENLEFEAAGRTRDQLKAIEATFATQRVARSGQTIDRDVFGWVREGGVTVVQALFVREGKLLSANAYSFKSDLTEDDLLGSFLRQFYAENKFIPDEVLFPYKVEDREVLESWLTERKGRKVRIIEPKRGEKHHLIEMARANAQNVIQHSEARRKEDQLVLDDLQKALDLRRRPDRIECFDVSNFQGLLAVGSMVSFIEGRSEKGLYRKYKIKSAAGEVRQRDDYAMLSEVLGRRLRRAVREDNLPDLVILDGGKGHLSCGLAVCRELGLGDLDIVALAKQRTREGGRTRERVFLPDQTEPVVFPKDSPILHLLQRIRDEAHRFAIGYHRDLRKKQAFKSSLEDVPGIGPKRRKALINHFGNMAAIREATVEKLVEVPGINQNQAEILRSFFEDMEEVGD